ncbi:MAG: DegT/DnrJ/EryC1/StrS family aminotransferase [Candidatus Portnoybacteria bacterium]|nr:DegT/DnrJ/EryC1/StrS family aminotransferase [Candidatus Portnoybacteria bacterium]
MIKLIKSTFYNEKRVKAELTEFIRSAKQLSFGPECEKFERDFAAYQGRKYCVFLNSGSSANLALIQSLLNLGRLSRNDAVGFSALTWATNVMPLIQLGLKPIPIDIELETLNVSSKNLLNILKRYPLKAIFITNLLGFCHDLDQIKKICRSKNIILLEDNCEGLGTIYKKTKLGNFGLASTFSFFVGHHMSTIEGGAVLTDDRELAQMLKMVRAHGWDRHLQYQEREKLKSIHGIKDFHARYTFYDLAYNMRPSEINGFLGNCQLGYLDEIVMKRNANFIKLAGAIYNKERFYPIKYDHIDFVSNFAFPILCRSQRDYNELIRKLERKIEIRPIVGGNMLLQPFFKKHITRRGRSFTCPNADLLHHQGFYFGNNPELTYKELEGIIHLIR